MKISLYPFIVSAALFGFVSLVVSILYSLIMGDRLMQSDDSYIIGFILAAVTSVALLIYLLLKELKVKWAPANYCATGYYLLISAYCLFIEYIGGEASGYGYFFLLGIFASFPAFILVVYCPSVIKFKKYGFLCAMLYLVGYINALSNM